MDHQEMEKLRTLDGLVAEVRVRDTIDAIAERLVQDLNAAGDALMTWEPIPLSVYGEGMPGEIRSSWVFVLRAGTVTGAERHPNSHQRMMSYRGSGDFQTRAGAVWVSNRLISRPDAQVGERWISIPVNVWHQGVVGDEDWVVVSFHTVAAEELIEERPDPEDGDSTRQKKYLDS
ncbi:MAG: hypothetical protein GY953_07550 [bacterium]|nr:hypothetical protein [bacterium]